jgi:hypothetical protein
VPSCCFRDQAFSAVKSCLALRLFAVVAAVTQFGAWAPSAFGQAVSGDFVLEYTGATGNLSLLFTGTGASGAGPVSMQSLDIVTLGDTSSGHPAMPSGITGVTPGQGGLNSGAAVVPSPSPSFVTSNTSALGLNGVYSQVFFANVGTTWRTFDLSNPGVSNRLNLGNIAPQGWTYSVVSSIFMTDPDVYGSYNYGKFAYSLADGNAVLGAVVPEPTSIATLGAGASIGLFAAARRKARKSGSVADPDANGEL